MIIGPRASLCLGEQGGVDFLKVVRLVFWSGVSFRSLALRAHGLAARSKARLVSKSRVAQWWEHSLLTNVARVQIPVSTQYVGGIVVGSLLCSERFLSGSSSGFPYSLKINTLPNSNSIWEARTRLNEFRRTPRCVVDKQRTKLVLNINSGKSYFE